MVTTFLSLAPETSSSYPTHRTSTASDSAAAVTAAGSTAATTTTAGAADAGATTAATDAAAKEASSAVDLSAPAAGSPAASATKPRRSSSISSAGSAGLKFLRLGPVHFGGDPREADFVLLAEE
jgi:hypothetical protein